MCPKLLSILQHMLIRRVGVLRVCAVSRLSQEFSEVCLVWRFLPKRCRGTLPLPIQLSSFLILQGSGTKAHCECLQCLTELKIRHSLKGSFLNALGHRKVQKKRTRAQMTAQKRKCKYARQRKRAQKSISGPWRKNCKEPSGGPITTLGYPSPLGCQFSVGSVFLQA